MEWFFWVFWTLATIIPVYQLLPHFGYDKLWALACVVPVGTIVLLWLMAKELTEMEKR